MKSLTLIPSYLLKNTVQRCLENPASPATKVLIPFLFSVLALLIFGAFQFFENQIREQLDRSDLRMIRVQEMVRNKYASGRVLNGVDEAHLWEKYCQSYESFLQAPVIASSSGYGGLPVIAYDKASLYGIIPASIAGQPRPALLLTDEISRGLNKSVSIGDYRIVAETRPIPEALKGFYNKPAIVVLPVEYIEPILEQGFTMVQMMIPKRGGAELEVLIKAYGNAEGRDQIIFSATNILDKLKTILQYQRKSRVFIGITIAVITSLTLGSLSLLEFRQESYILALLRSFGVRSWSLFIHYIVETSFLAFTGMYLAVLAFKLLAKVVANLTIMPVVGSDFDLSLFLNQLSGDYHVLLYAIAVGVILSSAPVAIGLRKPAGSYLP